MNPVDEEWRDVEVVEFPDHLVALDGVESRTEIDEKDPDEVAWCFQVLEERVKEACHSILSPSLGLVGKLVGIKVWSDR